MEIIGDVNIMDDITVICPLCGGYLEVGKKVKQKMDNLGLEAYCNDCASLVTGKDSC